MSEHPKYGAYHLDESESNIILLEKIRQLRKENEELKTNNTINEINKRLSRAEKLLESLKRDFYR